MSFGSTSGQVGLEDQFVLGLIDVDGGRPGPVGLGLAEQAGEGVFEERGDWLTDRNG